MVFYRLETPRIHVYFLYLLSNDDLAVAMIMTLAAPKKDSSTFHHPKKHHFLDTMFLHFFMIGSFCQG